MVFASVMASRVQLPWYALPAYPALAILLARFVATEWATRPTRPLDALVAAAWLVIALSPVNVGRFNPFTTTALDGMLRADLCGILQGKGPGPWPGPALLAIAGAGALMALATVTLSARGPLTRPLAARTRLLSIVALGALALGTAAAPLRQAGTRSPLDRLLDRAAPLIAPGDGVAVELAPARLADERVEFSLRRLPDRGVPPTAPDARWRLIAGQPPAAPAGGSWREILREDDLALWERR